MANTNKKPVVIATSGGFDPIHIGHIRLLKAAKALGDKLIVILNNDNWLVKKKGYAFMPENERKEIVEAIGCVDEVVLTRHPKNAADMSVCASLEEIRPNIFAKGGDRTLDNIPEVETCQKISCEMVFDCGPGGKIQSSSWVIDRFLSNNKKEIIP